MELQDKIETVFISELKKVNAPHYFIAVSGGCDSMVLLSLFNKYNIACSVLHVNYNLRGIDSKLDAKIVRDFCELNNIDFHQHECDLTAAMKNGGNLQNNARQIRYSYFQKHLEKRPLSVLCLAHHGNDQLESFWLAMARSGGIRAMAGMQIYTHPYLRPLLAIEKQEIYDYGSTIDLKWREDLSNAKNTYNRNVWRNVLLPELESIHPSLSNDVNKLQQIFRRQTNDDRKVVKQLLPARPQDFHLSFKALAELNSTQWIEFLDLLAIPKSIAISILTLTNGPNGKKVFIESNTTDYHVIWKESDRLFFQTKAKKLVPPQFKEHMVTVLPKRFSKSRIFIEKSKIKGDVSLRTIETGDRINPIGINGSKLVSNILKDAKVPRSKRKNIWLLVDEEKILAVVGYAIDKRAIAQAAPCLCIEFN